MREEVERDGDEPSQRSVSSGQEASEATVTQGEVPLPRVLPAGSGSDIIRGYAQNVLKTPASPEGLGES